MRRERRKLAYLITAAVALIVGVWFIWPLDLPMYVRVLSIVALWLWLQLTVWFSVRRRRSHRSGGSSRSEKYI